MDIDSEGSSPIRDEGTFYIPDPGDIILHLCRHDACVLGILAATHDGSEERLRAVNSALWRQACRRYHKVSPIWSRTYYRADDGTFGVVRRNGESIIPMDSVRGRFLLGDSAALPETGEWGCGGELRVFTL